MKVTINGKVTKEAITSILAEQKEKTKIIDEYCKKEKLENIYYKDAELEYEYIKEVQLRKRGGNQMIKKKQDLQKLNLEKKMKR